MSFRLSFIATNALLVAKLSEIPFAIFPIVVPLAGQTMYASKRADPDADLAARLLLLSKITESLARSSGDLLHSNSRFNAPSRVTIR